MDLIELENSLVRHKVKSPNTYDDVINVSVPFLITAKKLHDAMACMQEDKYHISSVELDVLSSLKLVGCEKFILSPTELYSTLLFSSGGMTKVLKKLEEKEFIKRIDNPKDKRSKLVQLTKKGEELLNIALKDVIDLEKEFFAALSSDERKVFKKLLFKILETK